MQTERLYFADAYLRSFTARVVARRERDGAHEVALGQSAFYPEGGGQPADHGTLDNVAVTDVQVEDGLIWHRLAAPLVADELRGEIDWARRFDHMQHHHGQHLLSAALERLYGLKTVSFHLGTTVVTIDIDGALAPAQAIGAEELANHVIWEDRPVAARFVSPQELATIVFRKAPTVEGDVRVVSVPDFDNSACGGTHPRSTGGVGVLHIRRWERRGNGTRIEFLCGERALRDYRTRDQAIQHLAATFSVGIDEAPAAVARLREAEEQHRKQLKETTEKLIQYEALELAAKAESYGTIRVVRRSFGGRPVDEIQALATALTSAGCIALLGTAGERTQLVFARPDGAAVDCGKLLRETLAQFGGRGGGQAARAQGGMPDSTQLNAALDVALTQTQALSR